LAAAAAAWQERGVNVGGSSGSVAVAARHRRNGRGWLTLEMAG
jgi:hypothetical protein